jgi:purine-binding chemotaxis protein CheW
MPVRENKSNPELQVTFVTFHLGSQMYALPISPVRQIIEMVTITPLPQVNHTIVGVINFHGGLVPIVDLRRHLGLPDVPRQLHTPIILVKISERLVGLIVDDVSDVLERPAAQITDPSDILIKEMGEIPLLQGLIQTEEGSILLLNPEYLLKSYNSHILSNAVDTLAQSLEQGNSSKVEDLVPPEISLAMQTVGEAVQDAPEALPEKLSKSRRRKRVEAAPEAKQEVAA